MNEEMNTRRMLPCGQYRPRLTMYHPNGKGTGCAVALELHPAHDRTDGSIMLKAANQMTIGDKSGPTPTFPRFDWEGAVTVKLDFNDLCKMLQVFRGECETIEDGRGLYHRSPSGVTRIVLRHVIETVVGYSLELYRTPADGGNETRSHILFTPAEALGLSESIAGAMSVITFGIPMLVPHDTSVYEAETREMRNASAA